MGKGELLADTRKLTDGNKRTFGTGMEDGLGQNLSTLFCSFLLLLLSRYWHSDWWYLWKHVLRRIQVLLSPLFGNPYFFFNEERKQAKRGQGICPTSNSQKIFVLVFPVKLL